MTVGELKKRLGKMPEDIPIVIEAKAGKKFHLLSAKRRTLRAGHRNDAYCWLPIGEPILSPLDI